MYHQKEKSLKITCSLWLFPTQREKNTGKMRGISYLSTCRSTQRFVSKLDRKRQMQRGTLGPHTSSHAAMYRSSYLREVRKEKYERSGAYEELPESPEFGSLAQAQGLENLQELNERFANYINRARVLEQRNAIFRKQLETFQRMDELAGLEEAFAAQIDLNRQRVRELATDRSKLEREEKDARRMLDEFRNKYRNECEYQQMLKTTLERLNKEADEALLCNLELQIESQFLQDDVDATKDRYRKNLMEIQTYVSILQQIMQTTPRVSAISAGASEEKLITERRIPILQSQLEEYKSILCQLQTQKVKLQTETTMLEQAIKNTQESYDDEIQLYNEQIETLRKGIEDAERTLEKYTTDCRQLSIYKQSLENELERYKRIIENEDSRLNSAIVGTPVTFFTQTYRPSQTPALRGRDITLVIQDIASAKPRQRSLPKKISKRKEITPKDLTNGASSEKTYDRPLESFDQDQLDFKQEGSVITSEHGQEEVEEMEQEKAAEDVPDGAQISKAFDKLCNIVRERIRCYQRPEPKTDFYTKGHYVLVTGKGSYDDPCFRSSIIPSGGRITVSDSEGKILSGIGVEPIPELPEPLESDKSELEAPETQEGPKVQEEVKYEDKLEDKEKEVAFEPWKKPEEEAEEPTKQPDVAEPEPVPMPGEGGQTEAGIYVGKEYDRQGDLSFKELAPPSTMSYEKVEVVESIEKFSDDKIQTYEETAMIVETMIEKTSKKKLGDKTC
ncbi:filensin isoform X3 [Hemicordylus capensis]|uniref:filensin isoform X3 n=1 Tax=Hemicordylus capensis TaxID=884348 RepID=UPI00230225D5|nr:filensin isoform X3 [Hemicordylus capensis]